MAGAIFRYFCRTVRRSLWSACGRLAEIPDPSRGTGFITMPKPAKGVSPVKVHTEGAVCLEESTIESLPAEAEPITLSTKGGTRIVHVLPAEAPAKPTGVKEWFATREVQLAPINGEHFRAFLRQLDKLDREEKRDAIDRE